MTTFKVLVDTASSPAMLDTQVSIWTLKFSYIWVTWIGDSLITLGAAGKGSDILAA